MAVFFTYFISSSLVGIFFFLYTSLYLNHHQIHADLSFPSCLQYFPLCRHHLPGFVFSLSNPSPSHPAFPTSFIHRHKPPQPRKDFPAQLPPPLPHFSFKLLLFSLLILCSRKHQISPPVIFSWSPAFLSSKLQSIPFSFSPLRFLLSTPNFTLTLLLSKQPAKNTQSTLSLSWYFTK